MPQGCVSHVISNQPRSLSKVSYHRVQETLLMTYMFRRWFGSSTFHLIWSNIFSGVRDFPSSPLYPNFWGLKTMVLLMKTTPTQVSYISSRIFPSYSQVNSPFWRVNHLKSPSNVVDNFTELPDISRAPRPNASGWDPSARSNAKEVLLVVRDRPPSAGIRSPAVQSPDPERFLQVFSGFFTDKTGNNNGLAKKI